MKGYQQVRGLDLGQKLVFVDGVIAFLNVHRQKVKSRPSRLLPLRDEPLVLPRDLLIVEYGEPLVFMEFLLQVAQNDVRVRQDLVHG